MPLLGKRKRTTTGNTRRVRRKAVIPRNRFGARANLTRDTHHFKRSFEYTVVSQTSAVSGQAFGSWVFSLSNLPAATEFQNMFDRYMITYVKLYVYLRLTPDAAASASAHYPMMYVIRDYDDSTAPASISQIFEHSKVQRRLLSPTRPFVIKLKPATLGLTYQTAIASTYTPQWRKWIDMAATNTPHYGLKYGLENWSAPGTDIIVRGTMWFKCKDQR